MLVLSRKLGEVIHVGPDITITVVDIDRGKISLGIEAPRDVPIWRAELRLGTNATRHRDARPEGLKQLLAPAADDLLRYYPVSKRVNSARIDEPDLAEPAGPETVS